MDLDYSPDVEYQKDNRLYDYYEAEKKPEKIDDASKVLAVLFALCHGVDWAQTNHIARNPNKYEESDASYILGKHPSEGRVNSVMAMGGLLGALAPLLLPEKYGIPLQMSLISGKAKVIKQNRDIGIK